MAEALLAQEHHDYLMQIREMELLQLDELHHGPTVSERIGVNTTAGNSNIDSVDNGKSMVDSGEAERNKRLDEDSAETTSSALVNDMANSSNSAQQKVFSFANITQVRLHCSRYEQLALIVDIHC